MEILVALTTLFVIGSVIGWFIELFFRRFFSKHKWVNPGFLIGPYLPIYGFGTVTLYLISRVGNKYLVIDNIYIKYLIIIIFIILAMTVIEYIAGIIFIKTMNIKLWDYSDRWGNIQGIICPLFSFLWGIIGSIYLFFIDKYLVTLLLKLSENIIYCFFIGIIIGMMIVDFSYSIHLGFKIKEISKQFKQTLKFDDLKDKIKEKHSLINNSRLFKVRTFILNKPEEVKKIISDYYKDKK